MGHPACAWGLPDWLARDSFLMAPSYTSLPDKTLDSHNRHANEYMTPLHVLIRLFSLPLPLSSQAPNAQRLTSPRINHRIGGQMKQFEGLNKMGWSKERVGSPNKWEPINHYPARLLLASQPAPPSAHHGARRRARSRAARRQSARWP